MKKNLNILIPNGVIGIKEKGAYIHGKLLFIMQLRLTLKRFFYSILYIL